jgi:hypothetical protein
MVSGQVVGLMPPGLVMHLISELTCKARYKLLGKQLWVC